MKDGKTGNEVQVGKLGAGVVLGGGCGVGDGNLGTEVEEGKPGNEVQVGKLGNEDC